MSRRSGFGPWAVELHGPGRVGRALLDRLPDHGIRISGVWGREGLRTPASRSERTVFVDATPPQYQGPGSEAWLARLSEVLQGGTPVVTCNKAPLALGWTRLLGAARNGGTTLSCSATVGGGTPILLTLRRLERSLGILRVEAALNGTLGYVCDRVVAGWPLADAVAEAARAGLCEPDPSLDLDGTDSYAKAIILHNQLFPDAAPLRLHDDRPRLELREETIRRLGARGGPVRAVATITPGTVELALTPFPEAVSPPGVAAPAAVRATLRSGATAAVTGPGAGPEVTAGALLGDLLDVTGPAGGRTGGIVP